MHKTVETKLKPVLCSLNQIRPRPFHRNQTPTVSEQPVIR